MCSSKTGSFACSRRVMTVVVFFSARVGGGAVLDAERDVSTGRGVDGRAREAVGRRDAGGAGTKRPAAMDGGGDGGRADVERRPTKKKKRKKGQGSKAKRDERRVDDGYD